MSFAECSVLKAFPAAEHCSLSQTLWEQRSAQRKEDTELWSVPECLELASALFKFSEIWPLYILF